MPLQSLTTSPNLDLHLSKLREKALTCSLQFRQCTPYVERNNFNAPTIRSTTENPHTQQKCVESAAAWFDACSKTCHRD